MLSPTLGSATQFNGGSRWVCDSRISASYRWGWLFLAAAAGRVLLATNAVAQSTREVRGASPYVAIENEPPPKLIVDPTPLAAGLAHDIVWIQYRVECS